MNNQIFSKYKLLIFLSFVMIVAFSCKKETPKVNIDGKMIKEIKSNIIITEDGQQVVLEEDSIAKIFYLVRHAEKDTQKVEPPLTEAGFARATKIADILRGTRIDAIYSTMTVRTLYTVDSLADIKAMSVLPYENKALKDLLDKVKESTEFNRIFIVGHSNTIPSITNTLAGRDVFSKIFDESEYDNFVILVEKKSGIVDVYLTKY